MKQAAQTHSERAKAVIEGFFDTVSERTAMLKKWSQEYASALKNTFHAGYMARASQGKETHAFEAGYAAGAPSKKEKSASQLASVAKKMFPNGHVAQALKKDQGKVPMQPEKTTSLDGLVSDADKRSEELAEVHDRSSVGETDAASDSGIVDVSNLRGMLDDLVSKSTEEKKSLIQDLTDKDVMDKQVVRATLFTSKHLEEVNSQQKQKIS